MIFYLAYYHLIYLQPNELTYSKFITQITALFVEPKYSKPSWQVQGFGMHEDRVIFVLFCASATLCAISYAIAVVHSIKKGMYELSIHTSLLSLVLLGCILYVGYGLGLQYA